MMWICPKCNHETSTVWWTCENCHWQIDDPTHKNYIKENKSRKLSYWIKQRHNPQFDKPYYVACGQLSKRAAKKKEDSLYGFNVMLEYENEDEYNKKIRSLKLEGYTVYVY